VRESNGDDSGRFRIAVVGDLLPKAAYITSSAPPLRAYRASAGAVDSLLSQVPLTFRLDVADPFSDGRLRVDLRIRELRDFRPDLVVEQVPALRALAQLRTQWPTLARLEPAEVRATLARALPVAHWAEVLGALVQEGASSRPSTAPSAPQLPPSSVPSVASGIDALLERVDVGGTPKTPSAGSVSASLIAQVARGGAARVGTATAALAARVDRAFFDLINAIVDHPEWCRLERGWRALRLLLQDAKSPVEVEVLFANPSRPEGLDALFAHLHERNGELEPPPDLIVLEHDLLLDNTAMARVGAWAEVAADLRAPLLVSVAPTTADSDDAGALLQQAGTHEWASWVVIASNGGLLRPPHTVESIRVQNAASRKQDDARASTQEPWNAALLFAPAAYLLARLCARSFTRSRWPSSITGAEDGVLSGFDVHALSDTAAIATERLIGLEKANEWAHRGVMTFASVLNRDTLACIAAPTLAAGSAGSTGPSLSDQLFAARVAGIVLSLGAAIPRDADPKAAEEAAVITLAELFPKDGLRVPTVSATVAAGRLEVTVKTNRFAGTSATELTMDAALTG
jgi:type VI secretion system ImpB/VipA family protein